MSTPGDDTPNPFKGTPFEQFFQAMSQGQTPAMPPGMPDFSSMMSQIQSLMQPNTAGTTVNWTLARDIARKVVAASPDPTPHASAPASVRDAMGLADHWLDAVTDLPSGITTSAAWSRAEWIENTLDTWEKLVEPVAEHVVAAMGQALPAEARAMAGPLIGMLTQAGGAVFGSQIGQALGGLAAEVLSASDIGVPLGPSGRAALLSSNIATFSADLDVPDTDVLLYLALREAAHQRLFAHVPWLTAHLHALVADYGRGTSIDVSAIEQSLSGIDPTNPAALQEALAGGLFEPQKSPAQQAALARLETALALVEGWVDEVVGQASLGRMPNASKLQELIRRRRAAGGPAEATFAALVGLELRPRRLRDAAALWGALRSREGAAARDAVWAHPDLMPTASDLSDPLGFSPSNAAAPTASEADFDAALAKLLDQENGSAEQ